MTICVIGAGSIGGAVAMGLTKSRPNEKIIVTEKRRGRRRELTDLGLSVSDDNQIAAEQADLVIICVKPNDVENVLREIHREIRGKLVISMAAAVSLAYLKNIVPEAYFVRVMPNIAILVQESFIAYSAGSDVEANEKTKAEAVLKTLGRTAEVEEHLMDAITAISGCAPAYLSIILEAMEYAGLDMGLTKELALMAAAQAMLGTGRLVLDGRKTPSEVKDMVTTPGGVTIAGLREIERTPVRHAFMSAIKASMERSFEISKNFKAQ